MSRGIEHFNEQPLPSSADALARKAGYRDNTPIAFDGDLASERCVEARTLGIAGHNHYNTPRNPPYFVSIPGSISELYVRKSVAAKLQEVNVRLAPSGLELYLFDAWRPQAVQRYFHDVWFPDWLVKRRPDLSGPALMEEVEKYWAAPTAGVTSPSPHSTGGAVDLTLIYSDTRQPLFMGGIFDDLTKEAWTDGFEAASAGLSMSAEQARVNRRLLYWVMTEAGFANNPTEWWHYSWGDQMWARMGGHPAAFYGSCDPTGRGDP